MKLLYVTDRESIGDARFESVLAALGGVPGVAVQLREKTAPDRETLEWARLARSKLGPSVPLFVNRRFDVALAAGADGVHLPADGLPVRRVRAGSPRGFLVGVSTHAPEEATRAVEEGADLVVLGPIFETPSKMRFGRPLGIEALAALPTRESQGGDVYAIGGIDESRLPALARFADRISGVAVVRMIQEATDPRAVLDRVAAT